MWKEFKKWVRDSLKDEHGNYSSKRLIGIISGLSLCITLFIDTYKGTTIKPSDALINAVAMLSFGALGLASVDKIWSKRPPTPPVEEPTPPVETEEEVKVE